MLVLGFVKYCVNILLKDILTFSALKVKPSRAQVRNVNPVKSLHIANHYSGGTIYDL